MTRQSVNKKDDIDSKVQDEMMLSLLRDIILKEDRSLITELKDNQINQEKLAERINPIIEYHIESLKRKFPTEYQKQVNKIVERKLKASQDELLDIVYPVMGKMVRKFVSHQFISMRENIDQRVRTIFSLKGLMKLIRSKVFGMEESELVLQDINQSQIQEIYIIERDSGLLMGDYSKNKTMDRDAIAGMLTAIKSFVEDAFTKERDELEMIEYGTYRIFIQSFHLYYFAIVLDGAITNSQKDQLTAKVLDFAEKEISENKDVELLQEELSEKIETYFK